MNLDRWSQQRLMRDGSLPVIGFNLVLLANALSDLDVRYDYSVVELFIYLLRLCHLCSLGYISRASDGFVGSLCLM